MLHLRLLTYSIFLLHCLFVDSELIFEEVGKPVVTNTFKWIPKFKGREMLGVERQNADGGINSMTENDKEEDYYYTTPISQQLDEQLENLKTRSAGGSSASSSPSSTKLLPLPTSLQARMKQLQPNNSR